MSLTIGLVLPDVLGTYGDDGNALVLRQRARMRGIDAEILKIYLGDPIPTGLDAYTIGGGEDTAQILAVEHLSADGGLAKAADAGHPILAICAGLQVLGTTFRADNREIKGLGLIDVATTSLKKRTIGEVQSNPLMEGLTEPLTGFANHMGATSLGADAKPLGTITYGKGNTDVGQTTYEGAYQGSVICTYMHGPALARNPQLADLLLARAMGIPADELEPLEVEAIARLRRERLQG